jgi:acetyltransferase-like isoleucine patch superfamily enzyme
MLKKIVNKLAKMFLRESANLRLYRYKRLYPGLGIATSVQINDNGGKLIHGRNVNIHELALLELPMNSCIWLGNNTFIARAGLIHPSSGQEIYIGEYATVQERCLLSGNVKIGRYSVIAPNFYASSGSHFFDIIPELTIRDQDSLVMHDPKYTELRQGKPIEVQEDCWIGINVSVMSGVTIGKGSIIGANSVVTKNIPPYSVAVGAPAKVIRKRLNFIPPLELDWQNIQHRPYFYSGFCIDNASFHKNSIGIIGYTRCTIYISPPQTTSYLCVEAAALISNITISIAGISYLMNDELAIYQFEITQTDNPRFDIHISSDVIQVQREEPAFRISRIWFNHAN